MFVESGDLYSSVDLTSIEPECLNIDPLKPDFIGKFRSVSLRAETVSITECIW
jgi:hypothetical protein